MKRLSALVVLVAVLATAPAASSQVPTIGPPAIGPTEGVRVVRERGAVVVVFGERAARLYRRLIAGKLVTVSCTELLDGGTASGSIGVRAPERRRRLATGDLTRGIDYCRVWLPARTVRRDGTRFRLSRRLVASVPVTEKGRKFLDEQDKTFDMMGVLGYASFVAERRELDGYPTYAQLARRRGIGRVVVQLAAPTAAPPAGKVGYYSDGREHVAVAALSETGRRLFIEYAPDDVLTTNVSAYMFDGLD